MRLFFALLIIIGSYSGYLYTLDESKLPPLKNGDLIFQTTAMPGAMAIGLASLSPYIHTGIIKMTDKGASVVHAADVVLETPLSEWIDSGVLQRFSVYRHKTLTPEQAEDILEVAKTYYGKPYDHYFSFDNDSIYCSELEHLAFNAVGVSVGKVEKIGSLNINNQFAKKLIEQRWQKYPACVGKGYTFEGCYDVMMKQELITPASIARDANVERIFTNYPF